MEDRYYWGQIARILLEKCFQDDKLKEDVIDMFQCMVTWRETERQLEQGGIGSPSHRRVRNE